jgi:hypothetical protein
VKYYCDSCNQILSEKGGLMFIPQDKPVEEYGGKWKFHLCVKCFDRIYVENILNSPEED